MVADKLIRGLNRAIELAGVPARIRYYSPVFDETYDEPTDLLQSGTDVWISGIVFSLNSRQGSSDSVLLEQGKLIDSDKKFYTNGSVIFNGTDKIIDIQIGSPGDLYTTIENGGITKEVNNIPVYKVQYIRRLTGSLVEIWE